MSIDDEGDDGGPASGTRRTGKRQAILPVRGILLRSVTTPLVERGAFEILLPMLSLLEE